MDIAPDVAAKVTRLRELLGTFDSVLVAFSGGVDSSFLLHEAAMVLGPRCIAPFDARTGNPRALGRISTRPGPVHAPPQTGMGARPLRYWSRS